MMGHNYILFIFYVLLNVFNIKSLDPSYSHNRENKGFYDVNIDKDDNKENHSANKRPNILPPNHSSLSQMCPNSIIRKGQIIKTNDSIQAGAKFLDIPRTGSVKECHEKCCNLLHCNTAVVKVLSISRVLCYLFDCGVVSRCSFDDHKDYKVIELKYEEQTHNDDLTTAPSVNENVLQNSSHMEEKSKVKCPVGYHRVGNECRENCSNEFYFECANIDRPAYRQCIATYDKCDGYRQCDDSSDEIDCPSYQDTKTDIQERVSSNTAKIPFKNQANGQNSIIAESIRDQMRIHDKPPSNPINFNKSTPLSEEKDVNQTNETDVNLINDQRYWKSNFIPYNNRIIDMKNGLQDQRELQLGNDLIVNDHSNVGFARGNTSVTDYNNGEITPNYDGHTYSRITPVSNYGKNPHGSSSFNLMIPLQKTKDRHYVQGGYGDHFKPEVINIDPYKTNTYVTLKGSDRQQGDALMSEIMRRPQNILRADVTSPRKNIVNWNYRFYEDTPRAIDRNINTQWSDGSKLNIKDGEEGINLHDKQRLLEDSNYAKELADYGNRIGKIEPEHKTFSTNVDDRSRKSRFNLDDRSNDGNTRRDELFDLDKSSLNVVDNPYYDTNPHLQNRVGQNLKRPQSLVGYYKKYSVPSKYANKYYPKDDSYLHYLTPSDGRLEYYMEYDNNPKQLYDYEHKLQNLDPFLHEKSMPQRISSSYFNPDLKKVRSGYFGRFPSSEDSNNPLDFHEFNQFKEQIVIKTTAQSTQSSLMKTTAVHSTKGMVNSPVIENVTTAVINSLKSTTPLSSKLSLKSFSGKYIELSKFSLHKIEDSRGGAVLVLSVGVGLIIVSFAVFVCQMQKFRKQGRNRKAKNMHGDSDYLINGLYL